MRTLVIVGIIVVALYFFSHRPAGTQFTGASAPPLVQANPNPTPSSSGPSIQAAGQDTFASVLGLINTAVSAIGNYASSHPADTSGNNIGSGTGSQGGIFGPDYDYNA